MGKLRGKVAVITGGTAGIGLAAAKLFVAEGAYVFITGRRQKELDDAVKEIGDNVSGVQGDVANLADLDRLYNTVKARGRIDIVFANAGLGEFARLEAVTEEHFDKIFDINVKGGALHGTEGATGTERRRFHHPHRFRRERQGNTGVRGLRREQGRRPEFRPRLDCRTEGPSYPLQRPQSRSDRHTANGGPTAERHREDDVHHSDGTHR
jgi:NAD(P)-dependent dehydrogenase (short-subunit alcohol dehydrogenase family)